MKFLIDLCAGRRRADWLREQGHDVVESRESGGDPAPRPMDSLSLTLGPANRTASETLCGRIVATLKALNYLNESVGAGYIQRK